MTIQDKQDIAVVIPARNEVERITECLSALMPQATDRVNVFVVVNNTSDGTAGCVRSFAGRTEVNIEVLECDLSARHGVGRARQIGCRQAMNCMPSLKYLLTTDADCIVAPDWISRNLYHLSKVDAVCGKIEPMPSEAAMLSGMNLTLATLEGRYRSLILELYNLQARNTYVEDIGHGEAAGASLAMGISAYMEIGGFADVKCGEDREIVRRLGSSGRRVLHASDTVVYASCRLKGRARGGMSDALKARINASDFQIDDCLPPVRWIREKLQHGDLGVWPPTIADADRVWASKLPVEIRLLEKLLAEQKGDPAFTRPDISISPAARGKSARRLSKQGSQQINSDPVSLDALNLNQASFHTIHK